ncbi:MAG: HD domain-containing protein [Candidatus Eisenbacteria bacterium]|uniref:HD domain-containing protein n=1 Tax=Eiseniibacteriota bacterium TaxID=2212470 RepID=A0A933SI60_UNCEI|nr:HD domain-containing protein [Candidatus Eisenbacteria bacterium]
MSDAPATLAELLDRIAADRVLATLLAEARARDAALATPDPAHDTAHLLRVALWTLRIGAAGVAGAGGADHVDAREAVAAALLHDAVHVPKDSPDRARASELAADFARERLAALGFEGASIARIAAAVRDHSFSRGAVPEDALGCALQDADRLEALGAIGWLRCIATGVRMRAEWFHPDDPWAVARDLDDRRYSVDHLFTKLLGLPATMRTEAGRAEAERRAVFLRAFADQLGEELGVPPTR